MKNTNSIKLYPFKVFWNMITLDTFMKFSFSDLIEKKKCTTVVTTSHFPWGNFKYILMKNDEVSIVNQNKIISNRISLCCGKVVQKEVFRWRVVEQMWKSFSIKKQKITLFTLLDKEIFYDRNPKILWKICWRLMK